jgi:hypothetical protein
MAEIKFPPITEVLKRRLQADWNPSLSDTINPVIVLESERPEYEFLQGNPSYFGGINTAQTPATANFLNVGLENPAGSKVLVLVEGIWGENGFENSGNEVRLALPQIIQFSAGDLANNNLVQAPRDTRWFGNLSGSKRSIARIVSEDNAAIQGTALGFVHGTNTELMTQGAGNFDQRLMWIFPLPRPFVISPGNGVGVAIQGFVSGAQILILACNFCWTERPMSSWELQAIPAG